MAESTKSDQASTTDAGRTTSRIPRGSVSTRGRIASGSRRIGGTTMFASGAGTEIGNGGGDSTVPEAAGAEPVEAKKPGISCGAAGGRSTAAGGAEKSAADSTPGNENGSAAGG